MKCCGRGVQTCRAFFAEFVDILPHTCWRSLCLEDRRVAAGVFHARSTPFSRFIMRIEVLGQKWITRQARIYAEYRLFAALSHLVDTSRVAHARVVLRRAKLLHDADGVACIVTVTVNGAEVLRIRTTGEHPYAAINEAVDRLAWHKWPPRLTHAERDGAVFE
jgi:ribosome-associated translation inhibitor RaiA